MIRLASIVRSIRKEAQDPTVGDPKWNNYEQESWHYLLSQGKPVKQGVEKLAMKSMPNLYAQGLVYWDGECTRLTDKGYGFAISRDGDNLPRPVLKKGIQETVWTGIDLDLDGVLENGWSIETTRSTHIANFTGQDTYSIRIGNSEKTLFFAERNDGLWSYTLGDEAGHNVDTETIQNLIDTNFKQKKMKVENRMRLTRLLEDIMPSNKWLNLSAKDLKVNADDLLKIIVKSYAPVGGHPEFKSPADITSSDLTLWTAIDVDSDKEAEALIAGKKTSHGNKWTVLGSDGAQDGKTAVLARIVNLLKQKGNYIEASHKIADILASRGVPIVKDEKTVRDVVNKPDIKWDEDGWYFRAIGGTKMRKRLFGKPN